MTHRSIYNRIFNIENSTTAEIDHERLILQSNSFPDFHDFDHYLYPAEFHQAVDMVTFVLDMAISEAHYWIRVQATKARQDLLVVASDVVARRRRIAPEGLI